MHGTYTGQKEKLKGRTAILQPDGDHRVTAQFDDLNLGLKYTHNWVPFKLSEWEIDEDE